MRTDISVSRPRPPYVNSSPNRNWTRVASLSEASVSVCQAEGYTVATLNTWWDASGGHAYSELSYSFEAGPPSVQFRNAGTYEQLTPAEISRSTKTEDIAATFDYDGEPWTSALGIGQYPERGHECVGGQVAD